MISCTDIRQPPMRICGEYTRILFGYLGVYVQLLRLTQALRLAPLRFSLIKSRAHTRSE